MPSEIVSCPTWSLDELAALPTATTRIQVTPSCEALVASRLKFLARDASESLGPGMTLVVVGGGAMMDEAKYERVQSNFDLICVPSLHGSGAELSPVVVLNRASGKHIEVDDAFVPDARVYWPELLNTVVPARLKQACGDVWSHALEALISPLAGDDLRAEVAHLIRDMCPMPLTRNAKWFEFGARACHAQARCSVGLIHGIAHVLEPLLGDAQAGHAALCSTLIWPVLRFNREHSNKWSELVAQHELNEDAIESHAQALYCEDRFAKLRPLIEGNWLTILRDPCSRTNGVLVRRRHLEFFLETEFA